MTGQDITAGHFKNRAVTDVFEPGSTIKPFTLSLALAQGVFTPDSRIMTGPGVHYVGRSSYSGHPGLWRSQFLRKC